MEVGGSRFSSMEVSGSFHRNTCKLPLSVEVEASHCFRQLPLARMHSVEASMSFHIPLHTSIYFHEYHKLPAAPTTLAPTLILTLSKSHLHGSWPTSNLHESW